MNRKSLIFSVVFASVFAFATSNKVIEGDIWKTPDHSKVYTPPAATDTLVGRVSTDTLTNKSMSGSSNTFTNLPFSAVTGTVPVNQGGTNLTSGTSGGILGFTATGALASSSALTANQVVIGGGAGATPSVLAAGSQYQSLVMGASNPGYGALNLGQSAAITGTLPIGNGGTGQATATAAANALLPSQTGNSGFVLSTNGTNTSWISAGGVGTVTSVAMTVPTFMSVSGSPITGSGTFGLTLSGTALPVANGGTAVTSVTTSPTASSFAGWDANSNLSANNHLFGWTTTATAAGTTTLTISSAGIQNFTGSTTQTLKLPVTSTLVTGFSFLVYNNSTGVVTVQSSGANQIILMQGGSFAIFTTVNTGVTTAAGWNTFYSSLIGPVFNKQIYTGTTTFSTSSFSSIQPNTLVKITCVGAGSNGGGNGGGANSGGAGGGGGGSACVKWSLGSALLSASPVTVTIGAHGTTGGTSSFGSLCSAAGGAAAVSATTSAGGAPAGEGGAATAGDLLIHGHPGTSGANTIASVQDGPGGNGGAGAGEYGGGGGQGANGNGGGFAYVATVGGTYGGGGGGGSGTSAVGAAGADGVCVLEWGG